MAKRKSNAQLPYQDPKLDVSRRVADLLKRMSLEEKHRQLIVCPFRKLMNRGRLSAAAAKAELSPHGIGAMDDPRLDPKSNATSINAVQRHLVGRTRLGIPALVQGECLHGHLSPGATVFPQAIGQASTWNVDLIGRMAEAAAREARAVGVVQAFAPDLDLARDPRWGRVEETFGEDPYLVERLGVAYIRGMQGPGRPIDREHMVATAKHFCGHGSPEAGVNIAPVAGSERDLRTLYLPPFEAAVTEAGVESVMPAYSEFDGVPAHASGFLLTRVLREQWGFKGYVFSDYGGVHMLESCHRVAATPAEAGRMALEAGMDCEGPEPYGFNDEFLRLVRNGRISEDRVDAAVARMLRIKFLAGLFEEPFVDVNAAPKIVGHARHRALALEVARESIVLLKNDANLLPLDPRTARIAVLGPNAAVCQFGDYTHPSAEGISPVDGIREAVSRRSEVLYEPGCDLFGPSRAGFASAVAAATKADAAVVCLGGTSHFFGGVGWGGDSAAATCGEGFDRTDLRPLGVQDELVRAVHATGTPTIVVLVHGRPWSIPWMAAHVSALIEAWYPGEAGGRALAEILFGRVNPSGKLPISVPRSVGHVPSFYNHKPSARGYYKQPGQPGKPGRDYLFSPPTPLFAFGHGLSYTRFKTTNLRVTPARIGPEGRTQVTVDVTNTGRIGGAEVVQLYLRDLVSSVTTPVSVLRRFEKVHLKPGETRTVRFRIGPEDLRLLNENMQWVVEPGAFELTVGGRRKRLEVV